MRVLIALLLPLSVIGFAPSSQSQSPPRVSSSTIKLHENATTPSPSLAQSFLNFALESPLWKHVMVPQARRKMQKTAESNGIEWARGYEWLSQHVDKTRILPLDNIPSYYQKPFHAYEDGNLSWQAAMELELASASVGARNVPLEKQNGEEAFRRLFEDGLNEAGANVPKGSKVVDLGCGTGISTRRLAQKWPEASELIGIDMSPYFVEVGKLLLSLQPKSTNEGGPWVSTITNDNRISLLVGDIEDTGLSNIDICQLQFVAHELPPAAARKIVDEAFHMLKPGGQFWMCEMDFEAPAYAAQRANPLLFSLIRATEPYLDDYADSAAALRRYIADKFSTTTVVAATGRHFALVATKGNEECNDDEPGVLNDLRFGPDGSYLKEDTHLKVWEDKRDEK